MANPSIAILTTPIIVTSTSGAVTIGTGTGVWAVGDEIEGIVSGAKAIITQIDNPGASQTMHFDYIDPFIVFNGTEGIQNNDDTGASVTSGAVTPATMDLDFSQCKNVKHHPGAQGAVDVKIKVTAGSIKFSVDIDPNASNPSYVTDDLVQIRLWVGNVIKFLAAADAATFEVQI